MLIIKINEKNKVFNCVNVKDNLEAINSLMKKNTYGLNCTIFAVSRNTGIFTKRFSKWIGSRFLNFIPCDINNPLNLEEPEIMDFVLHLASNTHPVQYAANPIETITTNIIGVNNLLKFSADHHTSRFAFASSNDIYGENRGDVEFFDEGYCGYINSNTMRAGYPESKRCGEALCQAYKKQKDLNIVISRLPRTYGPTMRMDDSKAVSQFIRKCISGEDIVLKSSGSQFYSFVYMADAVSGMLYILLKGENGEAYNIADPQSDISLRDLASLLAGISGKKVVFETANVAEAAGYGNITKARLNGDKLRSLGWNAKYDIKIGMERTIKILQS